MNRREKLLRAGMGLALFALAGTALNAAALPFARECYGYSAAISLTAFVLAAALFCFAGLFLQQKGLEPLERAAKIARPALVIALFALHLLLGYLMEYTPSGDNHMLYDGPQTLARLGDFGGDDYGLYLARFSNQWGFFLILTGFFRLLFALGVENTFYPLVIVQALLYAAANWQLLSIARKLRGVRAELMTALALALCLPAYLAAGVLYTDTFSLPFVVFTLRFALMLPEQKTTGGALRCALLCGLTAFIGCQIKMTVAIVLIAAVIVWLLTVRPARAVPAAILSFALVLGGTQAVHGYMTSRVLDPETVAQNNTPTIHWVMMSIPTADNPYGGFSGDYGVTWGMQEAGATREEVMDSIYSRMKDRIYTLRYPNRLITALLRKNACALGDGTFGMTEMLDDGPVRENAVSAFVLEGRPYYALYQAVCSGIWYANLLLAACGVWLDLHRRDMRAAIPSIAMLGMLLFLLLWEARGRYIFSFVPVTLLLCAGCASRTGELIETVKEGRLCRYLKKQLHARLAR